MRETILSHMNNVVANVMRGYQSDFTKYDVPAILNADAKDFPMIWQVGELHTFMLQVGLYARTFAEDEWKHCDCYEDYYITRVTVEDDGLTLYGYPKEGWSADEHWIDSVSHGSYGWIIDMIPETEDVKDVSDVGDETLIQFINGRK